MKLNAKQSAFVEAYNGNATEAALKAGYSPKTAVFQGSKLLRNRKVAEALQTRQERESRARIATRQQRQEFWTETMQGTENEMRDRLKASELLGKSEGDFLERRTGDDAPDLARLLKIELVSAPSANSGDQPKEEADYRQDER